MKMDMQFQPIQIEVADNRRFADIALLVDRSDFIKDITELRQILNLPISPEVWSQKRFKDRLSKDQLSQVTKWFNRLYLKYRIKRKMIEDHWVDPRGDLSSPYFVSWVVSTQLCSVYKKTSNFAPVIQSALATGVVKDTDYATVILGVYVHERFKWEQGEFWTTMLETMLNENDEDLSAFNMPDYPSYALYFDNNTPKSEIIKALDQDLPKVKKAYGRFMQKIKLEAQDQDVVSNIKQYRDWYWARQDKIKYEQILDNWNSQCPANRKHSSDDEANNCKYCNLADQNIIEQAVLRYKRSLQAQN